MSKLYFRTDPAGGLVLYHRSSFGVVHRVADIPDDMSLDAVDQRHLADEWMVRSFPDPLSALTVRRIINHHRAEQQFGVAIESLSSKVVL